MRPVCRLSYFFNCGRALEGAQTFENIIESIILVLTKYSQSFDPTTYALVFEASCRKCYSLVGCAGVCGFQRFHSLLLYIGRWRKYNRFVYSFYRD